MHAYIWICLGERLVSPSQDYSHIAFGIANRDFAAATHCLVESGVEIWQHNKSEGESLYFADLDRNKLEIQVGNLAARRAKTQDMIFM
jgi:hypothetical protein